jgi:hypothetical protein
MYLKHFLKRIRKRNHVAIWNWFHRYRPNRIRYKRRKVSDEFIIDKTQNKVGQDYF